MCLLWYHFIYLLVNLNLLMVFTLDICAVKQLKLHIYFFFATWSLSQSIFIPFSFFPPHADVSCTCFFWIGCCSAPARELETHTQTTHG